MSVNHPSPPPGRPRDEQQNEDLAAVAPNAAKRPKLAVPPSAVFAAGDLPSLAPVGGPVARLAFNGVGAVVPKTEPAEPPALLAVGPSGDSYYSPSSATSVPVADGVNASMPSAADGIALVPVVSIERLREAVVQLKRQQLAVVSAARDRDLRELAVLSSSGGGGGGGGSSASTVASALFDQQLLPPAAASSLSTAGPVLYGAAAASAAAAAARRRNNQQHQLDQKPPAYALYEPTPAAGSNSLEPAATALFAPTSAELSHEIAARAAHDADVLKRVAELQRQGVWGGRRVGKVAEPPRAKVHWDFVLAEMQWLANDFKEERKFKQALAKKVAKEVSKFHDKLRGADSRRAKDDELRLRRLARSIAAEVKRFWGQIEKLVVFKQAREVEQAKKSELSEHLSLLVDQTERFSGRIAANLGASDALVASDESAPSPRLSAPSTPAGISSGRVSIQHPPPSAAAAAAAAVEAAPAAGAAAADDSSSTAAKAASASAAAGGGRGGALAATTGEADADEDAEFVVASDEEPSDDESTIERQERLERQRRAAAGGSAQSAEEEANVLLAETEELNRESALSLEQLLAKYGPDVPPPHAATEPSSSSSSEPEDDDEAAASHTTSDDDDDDESEQRQQQQQQDDEKESEADSQHRRRRRRGRRRAAAGGKDDDEDYVDDNDDDNQSTAGPTLYSDSDSGADSDSDDQRTSDQQQQRGDRQPTGRLAAAMMIYEGGDEQEDDGSSGQNRIERAASVARAAQPTGYTLETTKVKTKLPFLLRGPGPLREYQHIGLDWLVTMFDAKLNGILADEMGLGKTIMTISLLAHLACDRQMWGPHLIVVPSSLLLNWEVELKTWCPAFKVLTYFGNPNERRLKRQGWSKPNAFHVCITSYKLILQDHAAFRRKQWQYMILDEAHNIKNFRSQRWQALLNFNAERRLLLTGTPLQNDVMELWSLMHFLMPHIFASHKEFKDWFANPLTSMIEAEQGINSDLVLRLHSILRPFLLRRMKSEVEKQLPQKYDHVLLCRLSKRQRFLYEEFMANADTKNTLSAGSYLGIVNILMQLRKVCNHPDLFEVRPIISPFDLVEPLRLVVPSRVVLAYGVADDKGDADSASSDDREEDGSHVAVGEEAKQVQREERRGGGGSSSSGADRGYSAAAAAVWRRPGAQTVDLELLGLAGGVDRCRELACWQADAIAELQRPATSAAVFDTDIIDGFAAAGSTVLQQHHQQQQQQQHAPYSVGWYAAQQAEAGRAQRRAAVQHALDYVNALRCSGRRRPLAGLGRDCLQALLIEPLLPARDVHLLAARRTADSYLSYADALRDLVLLPAVRSERMRPLLEQFVCIIPAARAPSPQLRCSHPNPSVEASREALEAGLLAAASPLDAAFRPALVRQQLYFPDRRLVQYDCGKLQQLALLLRQLKDAGGHRALVFTQMTRMLDILESFLNLHGYTYVRLDGSTPVARRQQLVERFNVDRRIFLFILSTRSGGIGINLTGADTVVFYDSDWNPALDQQAQDRCHRIGQTREVHIYRLVSQHTVEENILKKSLQKKHLDDVVIGAGSFTTDFFKQVDLRDLLVSADDAAADGAGRDAVRASVAAQPVHLSREEWTSAVAKFDEESDQAALKVAIKDQEFQFEDFTESAETSALNVSGGSSLSVAGGASEHVSGSSSSGDQQQLYLPQPASPLPGESEAFSPRPGRLEARTEAAAASSLAAAAAGTLQPQQQQQQQQQQLTDVAIDLTADLTGIQRYAVSFMEGGKFFVWELSQPLLPQRPGLDPAAAAAAAASGMANQQQQQQQQPLVQPLQRVGPTAVAQTDLLEGLRDDAASSSSSSSAAGLLLSSGAALEQQQHQQQQQQQQQHQQQQDQPSSSNSSSSSSMLAEPTPLPPSAQLVAPALHTTPLVPPPPPAAAVVDLPPLPPADPVNGMHHLNFKAEDTSPSTRIAVPKSEPFVPRKGSDGRDRSPSECSSVMIQPSCSPKPPVKLYAPDVDPDSWDSDDEAPLFHSLSRHQFAALLVDSNVFLPPNPELDDLYIPPLDDTDYKSAFTLFHRPPVRNKEGHRRRKRKAKTKGAHSRDHRPSSVVAQQSLSAPSPLPFSSTDTLSEKPTLSTGQPPAARAGGSHTSSHHRRHSSTSSSSSSSARQSSAHFVAPAAAAAAGGGGGGSRRPQRPKHNRFAADYVTGDAVAADTPDSPYEYAPGGSSSSSSSSRLSDSDTPRGKRKTGSRDDHGTNGTASATVGDDQSGGTPQPPILPGSSSTELLAQKAPRGHSSGRPAKKPRPAVAAAGSSRSAASFSATAAAAAAAAASDPPLLLTGSATAAASSSSVVVEATPPQLAASPSKRKKPPPKAAIAAGGARVKDGSAGISAAAAAAAMASSAAPSAPPVAAANVAFDGPPWTLEEDYALIEAQGRVPHNFDLVAELVSSIPRPVRRARSRKQCEDRWKQLESLAKTSYDEALRRLNESQELIDLPLPVPSLPANYRSPVHNVNHFQEDVPRFGLLDSIRRYVAKPKNLLSGRLGSEQIAGPAAPLPASQQAILAAPHGSPVEKVLRLSAPAARAASAPAAAAAAAVASHVAPSLAGAPGGMVRTIVAAGAGQIAAAAAAAAAAAGLVLPGPVRIQNPPPVLRAPSAAPLVPLQVPIHPAAPVGVPSALPPVARIPPSMTAFPQGFRPP